MKSYWQNHYDLNSQKYQASLLKQVGKTINGREIPETQVNLIVKNIAKILRLSADDSVIDLCCGNGLITSRLAPLVKNIVGVDFSAGLIAEAEKHSNSQNIKYLHSDVLRLKPDFFSGFEKVLMYEAIQHFSENQLTRLTDLLSNLKIRSLVFWGSIPDKKKLRAFYNDEEKFAFYLQSEDKGQPHMGRWWLMDELEQIVSARGFNVTFLPQQTSLYTAYYRFDVLLEKCR